MKKLTLNYKIWIETSDKKGIMGDGKWKILKAIDQQGSLMAATEALGITYRRTWGDLKKIEKMLGFPLLEKTRGGKEGGSTCLTPEGKQLVKAFDHFHHTVDDLMDKEFLKLQDTINALHSSLLEQ
ncbi:MAG: LysR family transcriptional regulator [Bacteroidia bacterium]|jgi:molybdate transport system regulatory protein|nr:LysR family transcriptional regulator [Bacteroidales bacterium]NCD40730.1 LysR family transcriptional regulator [Bacteroidia bacterium]MDD2323499.1 LysR family transcriptional regulator [Bacteroidales bacterium]MDD3011905.1 LysR family transcriptional regulator [Bacteroidales bacterium]MDD3961198.1 LysR family transcriptional regulator [Bacteroidales bacterium]